MEILKPTNNTVLVEPLPILWVWTEDDATRNTPGCETTIEALSRISPNNFRNLIYSLDHSDSSTYVYDDGTVMQQSPDGGRVGFLINITTRDSE